MKADDRRRYFGRTVGLAGASTIVITASFLGVLSVIESGFSALGDRIPWYLVGTSLIFLGLVFVLEDQGVEGREIIAITSVVSALALVVIALSVEGLYFAAQNPKSIITSTTVLYFLAAGMFGTGIGYWGIKHWREFTQQTAAGGNRGGL